LKLVGLIGYPLGHSITPSVYGATLATMGIEARCEPWSVPAEQLEETIARIRREDCFGANVTVPHKEAVIPMLDELDENVRKIGAVNCIVNNGGRLSGHNTDKYGFMRALREAGFDANGKRALLLGYGGAARAVGVGLIEAGVDEMIVTGRAPEKARRLAHDLAQDTGVTRVVSLAWDSPVFDAACRDSDLIVNCTPLGTRGREQTEGKSPIGASLIRAGAWTYDLVYNPQETPFLRQASQAEAHTIGGLDMLIYQGVQSIELWTGQEPPVEVMREAARVALAERERV
jgi:shikimate dehydrogenase